MFTFKGTVLDLVVGTVFLYFSSKYSAQIIRTSDAKEMHFLSATSFNLSYNSDGILIFNALSFILSPFHLNTILLQVCCNVNIKTVSRNYLRFYFFVIQKRMLILLSFLVFLLPVGNDLHICRIRYIHLLYNRFYYKAPCPLL